MMHMGKSFDNKGLINTFAIQKIQEWQITRQPKKMYVRPANAGKETVITAKPPAMQYAI